MLGARAQIRFPCPDWAAPTVPGRPDPPDSGYPRRLARGGDDLQPDSFGTPGRRHLAARE